MIYFYRWREKPPIPQTDPREHWVYDTKTGKEQRFTGTPRIDQNVHLPEALALKNIVAKKFPGHELERFNTVLFPDGEQVTLFDVRETKRALPWSQPITKIFQALVVQDQQGKAVRHVNLHGRSYPSPVGKVPTTNDFIFQNYSDIYLVNRNTGESRLLGAGFGGLSASPNGKSFLTILGKGLRHADFPRPQG